MRKYNYRAIKPGYLTAENFKKFVKKNPFIKRIGIANNGEIFLNPQLGEIFKHAHEKGISLDALGGVNFNNVSDEILQSLVKYQVKSMCIALDGFDNQSYATYRRNGNFDTVIANIKKLNKINQAQGSQEPKLTWQYILFKHTSNIDDIRRAANMAKSLNMHFKLKRDFCGFVPENIQEIQETFGWKKSPDSYKCIQLWESPQVNWDGRFFGCCGNSATDYGGRVFNIGLAKYYRRNKLLKRTKEMLMGRAVCKESPCYGCRVYKEMATTGKYVTDEDIEFIKFRARK
jgi:MoaA/NifB/PqqE/SkfB family radical SAM enzyme